MKQNPHDMVTEFFKRFDVIRSELIEFRESLAADGVAAFNANDAIQGAAYEAMFDRIQIFLECLERCQLGVLQAKGPGEAEQALHEVGVLTGSEFPTSRY
jgi:hypothetical protein